MRKEDIMVQGFDSTQFMIQRQIATYKADLSSWAARVQGTRDIEGALRLAAHPPTPGNLLRSIRSLVASDRSRALGQVDAALHAMVAKLADNDARMPLLMRQAQGHWPRLHREMERKWRLPPPL